MHRWLVILIACLPALAIAQDTITLRPAVTGIAGKPLLLRDVAVIQGDRAEELQDIQISPDPESLPTPRVDVAMVREILKTTKGINLGRITLAGNACIVHLGTGSGQGAPSDAGLIPTQLGGETVRHRALSCLAQTFDVPLADLKVTFPTEDAPLLAFPTAGLTVAIQPTGTGEMTPLSVRLFRGNQLVRTGSLRASVLIRREVAVAKAAIGRGQHVTPEQISLSEQWLPPTQTPATPTMALGSEARSPIRAGAVILAGDVEPPLVVARGDVVSVDCVSGTVVLRAQARALENARIGQVVRFQSLTGKREFRARVSGSGHAVALAGGGAAPASMDSELNP